MSSLLQKREEKKTRKILQSPKSISFKVDFIVPLNYWIFQEFCAHLVGLEIIIKF